jgi:hypothetical protein
MALLKGNQMSESNSHRTGLAGRGPKGLLAVALSTIAFAWAGEAKAHEEVNDWNEVMAQMEPLSNFFMHSRLAALLHVSIHDALNSIPEHARFETYLPPVETWGPAAPKAALASAGRTMLIRYINYYTNPNLPPPFYNPALENIRPQVENLYASQLATIPNGAKKEEGIRVGRKAARRIWNLRINDGWNNPNSTPWVWPNDDGDDNPFTGLPGQYVELPPEDTYPGSPQPAFYWWGDMTPWAMTSNDQFLVEPPPAYDDPNHIADIEEVRAYAEDVSAVRTEEQEFEAFWWEACPGVGFAGPLTFARQLMSDFDVNNYRAARIFALMGITQADAMISNVNSKNYYNFWRPFTAIEFYHPGGDWDPFLLTPSNQEYPAGHPMVSGSGLHLLAKFFGYDPLPNALQGIGQCGTIEYPSLAASIQGVIDARVWGGMHFRSSGEVGSEAGFQIATYVRQNFLQRLD